MKLRARYKTVGPKKERVQVNQARMDPETKSLQQEKVWIEKETYRVYFPAGHSIRVEKDELVRMGYHIKPRLYDPATGDVVDTGGDPYDLENTGDPDIELFEEADPEEDVNLRIERRTKKEG
ncbi:hypothetical protein [Microcystis sp. M18BS1]|nr:hypothetical protein [Microcystis sp. M18BS1]